MAKNIEAASVWINTVKNRSPRPALTNDLSTDVLVVGGGMAGILIAHRLRKAGVRCAVAEARTIGSGATQKTTAKITAQHGLIYSKLIRRFGIEKARLYLDANTRAIEAFRALAEAHPCDFEEQTAHIYSLDDRRALELEANAYLRLGVTPRMLEEPPLPIKTSGALAMDRQAQFHPLKLLYALAEDLELYENTFIHTIEGCTAFAGNARIKAERIVLATHYPLINLPGLYFMKLYQHRSYVLALEGAPLTVGMFLDERENGHSFRSYQHVQLVGGGDHRTGKHGGGYSELEGLANRAYADAAECCRWAAQDCMTLDFVPYIGRHRAGKDRLLVATGFNKWGMTGSMVAAELIRDLIVEGRSELEELYAPSRSMMHGQLFANLGASAAGYLSLGRPRCPHMGCKLNWNEAEHTWDCPCHGSRFHRDGHLIDNPSKKGIERPAPPCQTIARKGDKE